MRPSQVSTFPNRIYPHSGVTDHLDNTFALSTLPTISFDEWGGFFEHVPPSTAPDVNPDYELRGFRVPALVVSPFARRSYVATESTTTRRS